MRKIVIAVLTALTLLAFPPPAIAYVDPTTGAPGPGRVLRAFDKPEHNWLPGHRGVDMQGERVHAGQEIGTLAPPTDGWPGLHWGAKRGKDYLNPLSLLAEPHIRLKPVAA